MLEVILKRFEKPDEVRTFEKGKFELLQVGGMTIGRATYEPGWKWSVHVGQGLGKQSCDVEHVGMVISGRATAAMDDGRVIEECRVRSQSGSVLIGYQMQDEGRRRSLAKISSRTRPGPLCHNAQQPRR